MFDGSNLGAAGSLLTGSQSVLTACEAVCAVCPPIPPFPPAPTSLPLTTKTFTIQKFTGPQHGVASAGKNQADIFCAVLAGYLATPVWTIVNSCDAFTVATGVNLLTDYTKCIGSIFGIRSWAVIRNTFTGVELLFRCLVSGGWTEFDVLASVSGTFAGGATNVFPSSADNYIVTPSGGSDWLGTNIGPDNPQFYAFSWISTDGQVTRTRWFYGGVTIAAWDFDTVQTPVGGAWVPFVGIQWDGGNDYSVPASRFKLTVYATGGNKAALTPSGTVETGGTLVGFAEQTGAGAMLVDQIPQDQTSLQYLWVPPLSIGTFGQAPPRNGVIGYLCDQWWVGSVAGVPVFNDGDTADSRAWIFFGQEMLVWDASSPAAYGFGGTVDRPAASFYGRNAT